MAFRHQRIEDDGEPWGDYTLPRAADSKVAPIGPASHIELRLPVPKPAQATGDAGERSAPQPVSGAGSMKDGLRIRASDASPAASTPAASPAFGGSRMSRAPSLTEIRPPRGSCLLLHPEKPVRVCWEILGLLVIIWVTMSLPFKLAFLSESLNDKDPLFVVQMFVDVFFVADVALNFYTAYYDDDGVLITDLNAIKMHYLKTWFTIDFLGAIPFDYIVLAIDQHYYSILEGTKVIRLVKLLRLFRLLKLHNIYRFLGHYEEYFSHHLIKLFKLGVTLVLWLHFDACMYFLVARWHTLQTGEWESDSWVVMDNLVDAGVQRQYLYSFWNVASHMLSVTYGPSTPVRTEEVGATLASMLLGAALYAGIIGTTASIMQASDPSGSEFYRQWDELKVFMRHKGVPLELRERLRKYFMARWKGRKIFDESRIVASLPEPYVRSLLLHDCQFLVQSMPLLNAGGDGFVNALVPHLQSRLIMDKETVVNELEPPSNWWLLSRGIVGAYRNGRKFAELDDGHTLGEVALTFGVKAPFSVRTETPCQFYCLSREDFESIFSEYPELASRLKRQAYKQCRRWGLSTALREAAVRGEHATAFVSGVPWDWDAAEAELQEEAALTGESIDAPEDLFDHWAHRADDEATLRRYADLYGDAYDPDYDLHKVMGKLRHGFGRAGEVLQSTLHMPGVMHFPGRGRGDSTASGSGADARTQEEDDRAFLARLRRLGINVETAIRDPAHTLAGVRRGAQRFGSSMREGMRTVRDRIVTGVQTGVQSLNASGGMRRRGDSVTAASVTPDHTRSASGGGSDAVWSNTRGAGVELHALRPPPMTVLQASERSSTTGLPLENPFVTDASSHVSLPGVSGSGTGIATHATVVGGDSAATIGYDDDSSSSEAAWRAGGTAFTAGRSTARLRQGDSSSMLSPIREGTPESPRTPAGSTSFGTGSNVARDVTGVGIRDFGINGSASDSYGSHSVDMASQPHLALAARLRARERSIGATAASVHAGSGTTSVSSAAAPSVAATATVNDMHQQGDSGHLLEPTAPQSPHE